MDYSILKSESIERIVYNYWSNPKGNKNLKIKKVIEEMKEALSKLDISVNDLLIEMENVIHNDNFQSLIQEVRTIFYTACNKVYNLLNS